MLGEIGSLSLREREFVRSNLPPGEGWGEGNLLKIHVPAQENSPEYGSSPHSGREVWWNWL